MRRRVFRVAPFIALTVMAMPLLPGATASVLAQAPRPCSATTVPGPRFGGVAEYRLRNGVTVLLVPDSAVAVTTVSATYAVGSRHEGQGETGVAHLLEHMLFRGTPKHPDLSRELARRGARYNGVTTEDRTTYYETFPASDENLAWALDVEADRMVNGALREQDLPSERNIVLREIDRAESDPTRLLIERTSAAAYAWHPYGRLISGSRLDVERATTARLRAFYRRHYHPGNATVIIAGRFDERRAVADAERTFGRIAPRCTGRSAGEYSVEPPQEGERRISIRRPGDAARVMVAYHVPAPSHPDAPALAVLGAALTIRDEGFLARAVKPFATGIGSLLLRRHDPSLLMLTSTADRPAAADSLVERLLASLDSARSTLPADDLIARARASMIATMDRSSASRLEFAAELADWVAHDDWRLFHLYRDRLSKVTAADVRRVAGLYLQPTNRTVGVLSPGTAAAVVSIPGATPLVEEYRLTERESERVAAKDAAAAGAKQSPMRGDVTWDGLPEHLMDALRVDTLPNGLRLATLPVAGGDVSVRFAIRYGSNSLLAGRSAAGSILSAISYSGPADMTPAAFKELKDRLQVDIGAFISVGTTTLRVETKRDHVSEILRVLGRSVRNPRLDSATIHKARETHAVTARLSAGAPILLARAALEQRLWQLPAGHPLFTPATGAEREALANSVPIDDVAKIYRELWSPANMTLLVVGGFDRDSVRATVREVLGDWSKSAPRAEAIAPTYVATRADHVSVPSSGRREAILTAGQLVPLGRDSVDHGAMRIAAHIIGSGSITSRLGARIREAAGLSYTVRGSLESPRGPASAFVITANAAPDSLKRVEALVRDELAVILREGFTEEAVERAKEEMANSWRGFVGQPRQTATLLSQLLSTGQTFSDEIADQRRLSAPTAEMVTRAARKYIDPARLIVVYVGATGEPEPSCPAQGSAAKCGGATP